MSGDDNSIWTSNSNCDIVFSRNIIFLTVYHRVVKSIKITKSQYISKLEKIQITYPLRSMSVERTFELR